MPFRAPTDESLMIYAPPVFVMCGIAAMSHGEDALTVGARLHWRSVETREYAAYITLAVAARTDANLNAYFLPAVRRFDKVWREEMIKAFPVWRDKIPQILHANDFAIALHLGMLLYEDVFVGEGRMDALHERMLKVLNTIHNE